MKTELLQSQFDDLLTVRDLCKGFGGVTVVTVHSWRRQGLPTIVIRGAKRPSIRFYLPDVVNWAADQGRRFRPPGVSLRKNNGHFEEKQSLRIRPLTAQRRTASSTSVAA